MNDSAIQSTLAIVAAALFAGGTLLEAQFAAPVPAPAEAVATAAAPGSPPTGTGAEERRLFAQAVRLCRSGQWLALNP